MLPLTAELPPPPPLRFITKSPPHHRTAPLSRTRTACAGPQQHLAAKAAQQLLDSLSSACSRRQRAAPPADVHRVKPHGLQQLTHARRVQDARPTASAVDVLTAAGKSARQSGFRGQSGGERACVPRATEAAETKRKPRRRYLHSSGAACPPAPVLSFKRTDRSLGAAATAACVRACASKRARARATVRYVHCR